MDNTIVFLDAGFLSKLSKKLGNGQYIEYNILDFAKNLAEKQKLFCKHIFYYTAPPFQSEKPTKEEAERYKKYEKFMSKISKNNTITTREGRCQRLKIDGKFVYKQKAVDTLAIIDLLSTPIEHPEIKKIILVASDSDFVPVIQKLEKLNIKSILYTYYEPKNRNSLFSTSNELIKSVYKYLLLSKEDFDKSPLIKKEVKNEKRGKNLEYN